MNITIIIALVAALLGGGWYVDTLRDDIADKEGQVDRLTAEIKGQELWIQTILDDNTHTQQLLDKYQNTKQEIQYVDKIVTETIIEYRDRVPNRIIFPNDWVRSYNLSTMRTSASTEGSIRVDGTSGGLREIVDDATALQVITSNNRVCIKEIEKLRALQQWVNFTPGKSPE